MDRKKKFFIALGILTVVYVSVVGLNLRHKDDSSEKKTYNEKTVSAMIESGTSELSGFFSSISDFQEWFSFLLPKIELFDKSIDSDYCNYIGGKKPYLLLNKQQSQCVLFVSSSDDSARQASLTYKRVSSKTSSRGSGTNKKLLLTAHVSRPAVVLNNGRLKAKDRSRPKTPENIPSDLTMVFVENKDKSYYQFKNPDKTQFKLDNFHFDDDNPKPEFKSLEKADFKITVPEQGGVLVFKCIACNEDAIHISQND